MEFRMTKRYMTVLWNVPVEDGTVDAKMSGIARHVVNVRFMLRTISMPNLIRQDYL